MKKNQNFVRKFAGVITALAVMVGSTSPVMAATTQEVQGDGSTVKNKQVTVTADITPIYQVSLPASITLEPGTLQNNAGEDVFGYWYKLKYGVAGKIPANKAVLVIAEVGDYCQLVSSAYSNPSSAPKLKVIDFTHSAECDGGDHCKAYWTSSEMGSCDYNGTTISNCNYSYCCEEGHWIGVKASDVTEAGTYTGIMMFQIELQNSPFGN